MDKFLIDKEAERKKRLNNILIYGILIILVITTASITGIYSARIYNERIISQRYLKSNGEQEHNTVEIEEVQEETKTFSFPVYSEDAKNKINSIYIADSDEKIAYLTFDDGPSSNITPQILQTLENEGVKATFFVLGSRAELYPELVRQEYEAGHYIANHSYSHEYARVYASADAVLDEFNRTEKAIQEAIGNPDYHSYLFRFPGGSEGGAYKKAKSQAKQLLEQNNIAYINWNALTNDAVGKPTAESLINDLKSTVADKKRIVVLMHDTNSKQLTADTLPEAIAFLKEEGFIFKNFYDIMK